ncbi:DEAD/DEAH box helicase family protein [Zavarzinella formosa]|uniref:DEAD/DEAH box helicase family protein n=1 Tax=Zavarzinella formosa TaxID=360055 RepID=UPI0002E7F55A|nr:DEAD/DEAH box helicase family protein [Zavarzinella formosa]
MPEPIQLKFDGGTIIVSDGDADVRSQLPGVSFDPRTRTERAEGRAYRAIVEHLLTHKIPYADQARNYQVAAWSMQSTRVPFPHQQEAVDVWWKSRGRGVVVLPTGTGKTFTAMLAIQKSQRPALVITPTIDLLNQWHFELSKAFGGTIGLMGGGEYDIQPLTVTTYDSAYIHLDRWGNKFGLLVFDECHHLPGPTYAMAAVGSIAPYRLGLTATPERADGQESQYEGLIGPTVYRREIKELSGDFLADYETRRIYVSLTADEQQRYQTARETYRQFILDRNISLGGPNGWQRFIFEASRSAEGRVAFQAFREQKKLERAAEAKLQTLEQLLLTHAKDRILIFTADNATVYKIARQYLVPPITHQTKARERKQILERFHSGEYPVVVTSQVLNEGVDVPAANVGIVLSGTSTIRENVQRLGRLLRKQTDKHAILYEIVAKGTSEEFSSERRRQHHAFQ